MKILRSPLKTLRGKILISLFFLIIIPVVIILYRFYKSSENIVQIQLNQSNQAAVSQKATAMNDMAVRMITASSLIINDPETEKFLKEPADWSTNYTSFIKLTSLVKKLSNVKDLLLDSTTQIGIYDNRGYTQTTWSAVTPSSVQEFYKESWYKPTLERNGFPYWTVPYSLPSSINQDLIVMTRQINGEYTSNYGVFFISVPISLFFYPNAEIRNQQDSGIFSVLVDQNQKRLLGDHAAADLLTNGALQNVRTNANGIQEVKINDQVYFINDAYVPQLGWKLIQFMNQKDFVTQLSRAKDKSISWVIAWFLLFAIAFIVLMLRVTSPFKQLAKSMTKVGKGEFNTLVTVKGEDEIAMLGNNFNRMVMHLQDLISDLYDEQRRKQKAQFQALQAQINPHFLLNTLNSIKWMALLSGADHISEMITKLGKLLNFTMRNEQEFVTLQEELDYLQVYLSLQEIRYHDQILFTYRIPDALLDCEVLKFTLQPAVENSIIHGNRFPLLIDLQAEEVGGNLHIVMQDNGVGMSTALIEQVESSLNQPHAKFSGIGIRNVNERIKLHFGVQYGMQISSVEGEGVRLQLVLPLKRRNTDAENSDRR
ncbi:sensor histidine kinase [Paenibacillus qinlingensis]|uniref:Sensor histidine kinase YesM n=1 Tax=Paenibacillus qinlingensis TaxID=1837343 RepID=A0ABU1NMZ9_9BACL|nr:sensor histidine kinase [Paenibacillus qinlingensis]MDR6548830.1 sensor histidine kinase YesM [Paenibacillus qinlingensis]